MWHPTQKPVELGRYLVRTYTEPGDVVLDNAFGSGSFIVAAALEGRRAIGIEKNDQILEFKKGDMDLMHVAYDRLAESAPSASVTVARNGDRAKIGAALGDVLGVNQSSELAA